MVRSILEATRQMVNAIEIKKVIMQHTINDILINDYTGYSESQKFVPYELDAGWDRSLCYIDENRFIKYLPSPKEQPIFKLNLPFFEIEAPFEKSWKPPADLVLMLEDLFLFAAEKTKNKYQLSKNNTINYFMMTDEDKISWFNFIAAGKTYGFTPDHSLVSSANSRLMLNRADPKNSHSIYERRCIKSNRMKNNQIILFDEAEQLGVLAIAEDKRRVGAFVFVNRMARVLL